MEKPIVDMEVNLELPTGTIFKEGEDIDQDNVGLEQVDENQLRTLLRYVQDQQNMVESAWTATVKEFNIVKDHIIKLSKFNEDNKPTLEEWLEKYPDSEEENYPGLSGLDKLSPDDIIEIFGSDSPIISEVSHSTTVNRCIEVCSDYLDFVRCSKECRDISNAYMKFLDVKTEANTQALIDHISQETDPEKKKIMQGYLDILIDYKTLGFLKDKLPDIRLNKIIRAFSNENTVEYWLNRSRKKLTDMGLTQMFILEISKFETRFLEEKYHSQDQILLLYFLCTMVYANIEPKSPDRKKLTAFIFGIDKFIRGQLSDEDRAIMLENILCLEEQFVGKLPTSDINSNQ